MNIAFCITGEMRNYVKAAPSIVNNVMSKLNPEVFIFTWSTSKPSEKDPKFNSLGKVSITEKDIYNTYGEDIHLAIEEFKDSYFDEIDGVKRSSAVKNKEPVHSKSSLPSYYGMKRVLQMIQSYEDESGKLFDYVIRIRPDMMVNQSIPDSFFLYLDTLLFSSYSIDPRIQVSDRFCMGGRDVMFDYLSLFDYINEYWFVDNITLPGERLARYHVNKRGIPAKPFSLDTMVLRF